jgi:acyl carrier protein
MEGALNDSVLEKVLLAVEQTVYLENTRVSLTTRLAEDLNLGRFGVLRLALYLEEIFDLELSDDVLSRCSTIGDSKRGKSPGDRFRLAVHGNG